MIYPASFEHKIGFEFIRQQISANCISVGAKDLCRNMAFCADFDVVKIRLGQTAELLNVLTEQNTPQITESGDVMAMTRQLKVVGAFLSADDLKNILVLLSSVESVQKFFFSKRDENQNTPYPLLDKLVEPLDCLPILKKSIDKIIDQYGNIRDNASPQLAEIRHELNATSGRIASIMRRVISTAVDAGYLQADTNPTVRDGRLVIPVQPMNKRNIPGIIHDESASGKTFFVEPTEIVQANNRIRELKAEEKKEITRILIQITDSIRPYVSELSTDHLIITELDFIRAKAIFARDSGGNLPSVYPTPQIEWYNAYHPSLSATLRKQNKQMIPVSITLTPKDRILIISGPNAGGKSVCLKTVGVIQYMAQCGILPTLDPNSHMGFFSNIFIDIGDDQSIDDDLSTYSSHLRNMQTFLNRGNRSTLILIDEFGTGTEPQIGGAIAQAILHRYNELSYWGVITTHYQNIKTYAEETPGLINGSMIYDRHLMKPTYKLSIGTAGSSFALEIASKSGIPREIIDEARQIVGSDYVNLDKYLLDVARDKRYWENKRVEIHKKEKQLAETIERYEADATQLRQQRRQIIQDAKDQATQIIEQSNAAIERTIHDIKRAQAEREATIDARKNLVEQKKELAGSRVDAEHPLLKKAPKSKPSKPKSSSPKSVVKLGIGDTVKLDGGGTPGKILSIDGKNATVAFGNLKTTVPLQRLSPSNAQIKTDTRTSYISSATTEESRRRQLNFKQEIDVRGMRADEAIQAVTYFIDDAIQFNASQVRILHGTGTGALRQAIRQYLATVNGVKTYHDEDVRLGGAGITVVQL